MSFSFRPLVAVALFALLAACSSKSSATKTECTSQAYPSLACGTISSCASGSEKSGCTATHLALPDGTKFDCAACGDCTKAQEAAVAACGGTPAAGGTGMTTPDAGEATPPQPSGDNAGTSSGGSAFENLEIDEDNGETPSP
jgi:hypothetical protein